MPEKDCVSDDNLLYCWNDKTLEIDVYTKSSLPVDKVPKHVLVKLMHQLSARKCGNFYSNFT
jgi:hypothetical protein